MLFMSVQLQAQIGNESIPALDRPRMSGALGSKGCFRRCLLILEALLCVGMAE